MPSRPSHWLRNPPWLSHEVRNPAWAGSRGGDEAQDLLQESRALIRAEDLLSVRRAVEDQEGLGLRRPLVLRADAGEARRPVAAAVVAARHEQLSPAHPLGMLDR